MRFDQSPLFSSKVNVSAGGKVIVRLIPALAAGQMELAGIFLSCTTNKRYFILFG
jgi:hypothetical protein